MKKYLVILSILWACAGEAQKIVLPPTEFQAKLRNTPDAILLDVRTPEEIVIARIEDSQSIVFDDSFDTKLDKLEQKPIFVYCASGKRSAKAAKILRDKGHKNVFELEGGINAWQEAGLPIKSSPQ